MSRNKNKKPLLNEGTVRRFMKLAEIDSLSDPFVDDLYEEEEEELDLGAEEMPPAELGGEDEADLDMGPPEGEGEVDVEGLVSAIADAIEAETGVSVSVEGGEAEEAGLEPPADAPEEELPPAELDMGSELGPGAEEEEALPPGGRGMYDEGLETQGGNKHKGSSMPPENHKFSKAKAPAGSLAENEDEEEGLEEADVDVVDDDALVAEVARRVAARLVKESRKRKNRK
jgi:hypothetical protein